MANKQASRGRAITTVEELIVRHPAPTLRLRMPTRQRNTNSNLSSGLVLVGLAAPQILQRETSTSALDQQNTHFSVRNASNVDQLGWTEPLRNLSLQFYQGLRHGLSRAASYISDPSDQSSASSNTTEDNIKKLRTSQEILKETFLRLYSEQQANAAIAMTNMTEQQQEEFLGFWSAVGDLLVESVDWIGKLNEMAIQLILKDKQINMNAVKKIFGEALRNLESISDELRRLTGDEAEHLSQQ